MLLSVAAAAAFFVLLLWFLSFLRNRAIERTRRDRASHTGDEVMIDVAAIARDMRPLFGTLNLKGCRIRIIGGDGAYLLGNRAVYWRRLLRDWIQQGATIEYTLLCPGPLAKTKHRALQAKLSKTRGDYDVWFIDADDLDDRQQRLFERYLTFHPTLVVPPPERPNEAAMWIETDHPVGATYAYGVRFIGPDAMNQRRREDFDHYCADLDVLQGRVAAPPALKDRVQRQPSLPNARGEVA